MSQWTYEEAQINVVSLNVVRVLDGNLREGFHFDRTRLSQRQCIRRHPVNARRYFVPAVAYNSVTFELMHGFNSFVSSSVNQHYCSDLS